MNYKTGLKLKIIKFVNVCMFCLKKKKKNGYLVWKFSKYLITFYDGFGISNKIDIKL